jgi:hypothetical protein
MRQSMPGDAGAKLSADFPRLAGTHLPMNNPALEFVKTLTHVLSLDTDTESEGAVFLPIRLVFWPIHSRRGTRQSLRSSRTCCG